jgi:glutamyl-tRNA reductase
VAAADVIFTAATSNAPLLDAALVARAQAQRAERPLVLVDLAVPRNIHPSVGELPGVRLFDVDDLRSTLDEALAARQREIPRVEAIIEESIARLQRRFRELTVKPVIIDLREKAEAIRQRELARTLRHLGDVEPQVLAHVQHLSKALVNQLLHEPTLRLKQKAVADDVGDYAETFRDLFGLVQEVEVVSD